MKKNVNNKRLGFFSGCLFSFLQPLMMFIAEQRDASEEYKLTTKDTKNTKKEIYMFHYFVQDIISFNIFFNRNLCVPKPLHGAGSPLCS